jgi:hypothetical protein
MPSAELGPSEDKSQGDDRSLEGSGINDDVFLFLTANKEFDEVCQAFGADATQNVFTINFEPTRPLSLTAGVSVPPPKMFFRTFWRALSRKLVRKNRGDGHF